MDGAMGGATGGAIRLAGVGRRYAGRAGWALRGIDLELPAGHLLRVEGGNGSGKSTLLRLLAGIEAPSEGRVTGRPAPHAVGYVPERFPAALPLTALGYLTHLGRVRGLRGRAATREAGALLERFGAGAHAHTRLRELSKGSAQKIALAQALLGRVRLLLLDEAWTGLDHPASGVLDEAVRERLATGTTTVFVDHDPGRLAAEPDAVLRVTAGRGALVLRPEAGVPVARGAAGCRFAGPAADGPVARRVDGAVGALVRIEAIGAPGARCPVRGAEGDVPVAGPDGMAVLNVRAADSDDALRALLGARQPWHVRAVHRPAREGDRG